MIWDKGIWSFISFKLRTNQITHFRIIIMGYNYNVCLLKISYWYKKCVSWYLDMRMPALEVMFCWFLPHSTSAQTPYNSPVDWSSWRRSCQTHGVPLSRTCFRVLIHLRSANKKSDTNIFSRAFNTIFKWGCEFLTI